MAARPTGPADAAGQASRSVPLRPTRLTKLHDQSRKLREEIAELHRLQLEHLRLSRDTGNMAVEKQAELAKIERQISTLTYGLPEDWASSNRPTGPVAAAQRRPSGEVAV
jgi:hypothetical protein